jgi:hypothetical protein
MSIKEFSMKTLQATVDINAPVHRVWSVLSDVAAYPEWNPFIRKIEGTLQPGSRLTVRIEPPGGPGMTFKPTVQVVEPDRLVRWLGRLLLPGVFDGEHSLALQPIDSSSTRFIQSERFSGILVPLLGSVLTRTQRGFEEMNQALKARAEKG